MTLKPLSIAVPAALLALANGAVNAKTVEERCHRMRHRQWDQKVPEKNHKLVDYAGRCVIIPGDAASPGLPRTA